MDVFRAVADPVRRALIEQLAGEPRRVVDLTASQEISRPAISKHLRILADAGLVSAEDRGRERWYVLRAEALDAVTDWADRFRAAPPVPEHALDALDLEVRRVVRDRRPAAARRPGAEQSRSEGESTA
ncbi:metalloregulator ArsR/SmtB family transcription factor [Georgenia halophila]|uniref:ArsR/SmtB family transcription factor n=1 Tax=Georgenia halophila TaxID=620889 RepID=UPI0031E9260D